MDFSHSVQNGNYVTVVIIEKSKFQKAIEKVEDLVELSQIIDHEIRSHITFPIEFSADLNGLDEKQEHKLYHGNASHYSPAFHEKTPGTPRQFYIDEATELASRHKEDSFSDLQIEVGNTINEHK